MAAQVDKTFMLSTKEGIGKLLSGREELLENYFQVAFVLHS